MLSGPWRTGSGPTEMLQQLDVPANTNSGRLLGRSLHAQVPLAPEAVRGKAEPGRTASTHDSFSPGMLSQIKVNTFFPPAEPLLSFFKTESWLFVEKCFL